jgi:hypothetical protein
MALFTQLPVELIGELSLVTSPRTLSQWPHIPSLQPFNHLQMWAQKAEQLYNIPHDQFITSYINRTKPLGIPCIDRKHKLMTLEDHYTDMVLGRRAKEYQYKVANINTPVQSVLDPTVTLKWGDMIWLEVSSPMDYYDMGLHEYDHTCRSYVFDGKDLIKCPTTASGHPYLPSQFQILTAPLYLNPLYWSECKSLRIRYEEIMSVHFDHTPYRQQLIANLSENPLETFFQDPFGISYYLCFKAPYHCYSCDNSDNEDNENEGEDEEDNNDDIRHIDHHMTALRHIISPDPLNGYIKLDTDQTNVIWVDL